MFHPSFAPAQPYRLRAGPADESDEDSHYGRTYARTPFPQFHPLGSPPSDGIIPGIRPRCEQ